MSECNGKEHDLIDIFVNNYHYGQCEKDVIRWCQYCGAIVIDTVVDGRTRPGAVMPMQFPKILNRKQKNCVSDDGVSDDGGEWL